MDVSWGCSSEPRLGVLELAVFPSSPVPLPQFLGSGMGTGQLHEASLPWEGVLQVRLPDSTTIAPPQATISPVSVPRVSF